MNLKVFALVTAVALAVSAFTMSNLAQPVQARNNDKCATFRSKDRDETGTECLIGDKTVEGLTKDFKKECKENTDNK